MTSGELCGLTPAEPGMRLSLQKEPLLSVLGVWARWAGPSLSLASLSSSVKAKVAPASLSSCLSGEEPHKGLWRAQGRRPLPGDCQPDKGRDTSQHLLISLSFLRVGFLFFFFHVLS